MRTRYKYALVAAILAGCSAPAETGSPDDAIHAKGGQASDSNRNNSGSGGSDREGTGGGNSNGATGGGSSTSKGAGGSVAAAGSDSGGGASNLAGSSKNGGSTNRGGASNQTSGSGRGGAAGANTTRAAGGSSNQTSGVGGGSANGTGGSTANSVACKPAVTPVKGALSSASRHATNDAAGTDCVGCHSPGGTLNAYPIGGTLYTDASGKTFAAGATVTIGTLNLVTNQYGNFYTATSVPLPPTQASVSSCPSIVVNDVPSSITDGSCNNCHGTGKAQPPLHL